MNEMFSTHLVTSEITLKITHKKNNNVHSDQ